MGVGQPPMESEMPSQDSAPTYHLGRVMPDQVVTVFAVRPDGKEDDLITGRGEHPHNTESLIRFLQELRGQGFPIPQELDEAAYAAFPG